MRLRKQELTNKFENLKIIYLIFRYLNIRHSEILKYKSFYISSFQIRPPPPPPPLIRYWQDEFSRFVTRPAIFIQLALTVLRTFQINIQSKQKSFMLRTFPTTILFQ